jgi:hypothetical protein
MIWDLLCVTVGLVLTYIFFAVIWLMFLDGTAAVEDYYYARVKRKEKEERGETD